MTNTIITKDEREGLNIANCQCCLLASNMRDCKKCPFNVGLIFKTLATVKTQTQPVNLANLNAQRAAFIQKIQDSNLALSTL